MNYEEKYKSALKWMQSLYGGLHGAAKEEAEKYFPELKESEGERIRKKLISFVENWKNFRPNSPFDDYAVYTSDRDECDRILAWLEKQGEPEGKENDDVLTWLRTFIEEEAYYLSMDIRDEADRKKLIKLQNVLAWLEKQGEQKTDDVENYYHKFDIQDARSRIRMGQ